MNFAGHVEVARDGSLVRGDNEARFHLGAVLPDLAAMGRFRLLARPDDPDITAGIDIHHRTDDAFHRHRWFRDTSGAVVRRLDRAGVPRGAARAVGHVGIELLLDGHLLRQPGGLGPAVDAAIEAAGDAVEELVPLVDEGQRGHWRHHLEQVAVWSVPDDYHRPDAVAARLERILRRRPRLALPPEAIATVAEALATQQDAVRDGAAPLIAELRHQVSASPG
ncbi:MAG: hypothetical protein AAGA93_17180 [Actinomycetota bacterium]